jgi:2,3-bisphosphoglycerate-dependent phosphoglycerate mutase
MNYFVLIRHGESEWNKENKFTGFTDVDLSPAGIEEAKAAGHAIKEKNIKIDAIFTSTLKRAYNTASLAMKEAGQEDIEIIRHDDLRERDYGDLTGLNKDEMKKKFGEEQVHIWRRSYDVPPPGGESLKDVVDRVRPYFNEHIKPLLDAGKNVAVFGHGNTNRALLIILGENTPENINSAEIPTGVPLVFEMDKSTKKKNYFLKKAANG